MCDRFAAEGFVALAPDLYRGETTTEPDEAGKLMMALNIEQAAKDMAGAVDEVALLAGGDRVGVTGFCMGGGLALVLATQRPDKVKAVRALVRDHPVARRCSRTGRRSTRRCSGHFAENDGFFTPEAVAELEDKLEALGKDAELIVHPGVDHAFFNDTRPEVYDAETAGLCWQQTVGFLKTNLA